jgi:hypothetical protein
MSIEAFKERALDILSILDYDMWKEAIAEPEEWDDVLTDVADILQDVFNDGYTECQCDHGLDQP